MAMRPRQLSRPQRSLLGHYLETGFPFFDKHRWKLTWTSCRQRKRMSFQYVPLRCMGETALIQPTMLPTILSQLGEDSLEIIVFSSSCNCVRCCV